MALHNVAFAMITSTLMGMLLWSLMAAYVAGEFLALSTTQYGSKSSWHMLYGLQSVPRLRPGHYLAKAARRR